MIRFQRLFFCVCFDLIALSSACSVHTSLSLATFFSSPYNGFFSMDWRFFTFWFFILFFFVMFAPYLSVAVLTDSLLKTMFAFLCPVFVVYVYASLSLPSRKL